MCRLAALVITLLAGATLPGIVDRGISGAAVAAAPGDRSSDPLLLFVDATDAPRGILHARLEIPAQPGPLTLYYPKWIPGEHAPSGPIADLTGIRLRAQGRTIPWQRDPDDMYAIRCVVPGGAGRIEVELDGLQNTRGAFSAGGSTDSQLAVLSWNQLVLHPMTGSTDQLMVTPRLRLPEGWEYGTALETTGRTNGEIVFAPVSLTSLIDSPVIAGAHHRRFDLSTDRSAPVAIDLVCDGEAGLAASPEIVAAWRRLVDEAGALFGAHHYRRYNFLLTLSDDVAHFGLEHHESSDDRVPERALVDGEMQKGRSSLLPHEYVHSWIGKYRRPAGLAKPDYQKTEETDLLWVYEGLTTYLAFVLASRSGLATPEWQRGWLAEHGARLDKEPGRSWRPLEDVAISAQFLYGAPDAWSSWRRGVDFYDEGLLIWLDADVLIRRQTKGARSLDDFCKLFAGGTSGPPEVVPFTFEEVAGTLNRVVPYDWRGFLTARIDAITTRAPLGGITDGGWRIAWSDSLGEVLQTEEKQEKFVDESFSIGIYLDEEGKIADVLVGSPAALAGLAPGMKPIAINGRHFNPDRLREELRAAKNAKAPLEILAEQGDFVRAFRIDWHESPQYPVLERDRSKPDVLSEILKPLTNRATRGAGRAAPEQRKRGR